MDGENADAKTGLCSMSVFNCEINDSLVQMVTWGRAGNQHENLLLCGGKDAIERRQRIIRKKIILKSMEMSTIISILQRQFLEKKESVAVIKG